MSGPKSLEAIYILTTTNSSPSPLSFNNFKKTQWWLSVRTTAPSISLAYLLKGNWSCSTCSCPTAPLTPKLLGVHTQSWRFFHSKPDVDKVSVYKFGHIPFKICHFQHTSLSLFLLGPWKNSAVYILRPNCPLRSNVFQLSCCWGTSSPFELRIMVAGLPRPSSATISSCKKMVWRGGLECAIVV